MYLFVKCVLQGFGYEITHPGKSSLHLPAGGAFCYEWEPSTGGAQHPSWTSEVQTSANTDLIHLCAFLQYWNTLKNGKTNAPIYDWFTHWFQFSSALNMYCFHFWALLEDFLSCLYSFPTSVAYAQVSILQHILKCRHASHGSSPV